MPIKKIIEKLINKLGYDIRSLSSKSNKIRKSIGESYSLIAEIGFKPTTVIDVGIASGTPDIYAAFPDAYFLLVEPLKEFEASMISILKRYNGSYVLAAAGSRSGEVDFNVHTNHLAGSSLYEESMGTEADGRKVTVPMIRIDDVLLDKQLNGPYLIKIDVQGAELDVLDGATQALLDAEVVVLEVSLFEFMKGAPQFSDMISYMKNRGFVAYDIVLGWNRPLDNALGQVDIVFVQEKGIFRRDHSYSTTAQMKALFGS